MDKVDQGVSTSSTALSPSAEPATQSSQSSITSAGVPVYDWTQAGHSVGCGTAFELEYWTNEGVASGVSLGNVLTHEPASMDAKRRADWGVS